jgi:dCMP deaminase
MAIRLFKGGENKSRRPEKDDYYMSIARQISQRSTCLGKRYGAIIVKDDNIVAAGYVGSARGTPNCIDIGGCAQEKGKGSVDSCRGVHAELNTIINAARAGASVLGGIMYLWGEHVKDDKPIFGKPCKVCRRVLVNAGVSEVVVPSDRGLKRYRVEFWVKESKKSPFAEMYEK